MGIRERMEATMTESRIEFGRTEATVVTPYNAPPARPDLYQRIEGSRVRVERERASEEEPLRLALRGLCNLLGLALQEIDRTPTINPAIGRVNQRANSQPRLSRPSVERI